MIYHVTADFRTNTAAAFLEKLTDGSIADQKPDGSEIVASMDRAVVNSKGAVEWSELCYCDTPLAHERATVLDHHFKNIRADPIESNEKYQGRPFMEYLRELA